MASSFSSSSSRPLTDRVAIVTGASRGIGRAIAVHLHSLGAKVVINYALSSTQADLLASELNNASSSSELQAVAVQADVSDPDQVKLLFEKSEQVFGPIHILVNCAGVLDPKYPTIANTALEDWDRTFNINTRGYGAYAASKAAVETMTKIVAKEVKGTKITANCVAPGPVATELFFEGKTEETIKRIVDACPLERLGEPKDVAHFVGFLASDAGEWINGQVVRVNGGFVV
ncbi:NADPH-dependent aldehyde reductase-like protein, chloroplastic isoform X1 [Prosopis cineraria]|uniref:NADPH-dependent aldehyde reductase-like protein, chloroplastic isoform X1 n=1 Tax=Prosopis cineraria TaxID=364024 RepID=UPI00240EEF67|nr:NADPH-dependent aldehyde reductase-like protein, chloroplastic isoform X1 [Prosopis cineraria]